MAEILSQEEIDALLKNVEVAKPGTEEVSKTIDAREYDFRHPRHISSEQLREIEAIHQNFSRDLSIKLTADLHDVVAISVDDTVDQTYGEYLSGIFSPTCFYSFSGEPIEGLCAINVTMDAAFPMIDKMLGGIGEQMDEKRELTDIESAIMDNIMETICATISSSWSRIFKFTARIAQKDFSPDTVFVVDSSDMTLTVPFEIVIGTATKGTFSICYSSTFLKPIIESMSKKRNSVLKEQASFREKIIKGLNDALLDLVCDLPEEKMSIAEILSIKVNDIIKTSFKTTDKANININEVRKAFGNILSEDNKRGCKISELFLEEHK